MTDLLNINLRSWFMLYMIYINYDLFNIEIERKMSADTSLELNR